MSIQELIRLSSSDGKEKDNETGNENEGTFVSIAEKGTINGVGCEPKWPYMWSNIPYKHSHNTILFDVYCAIVKRVVTCSIMQLSHINSFATAKTKVGAYYTQNYESFRHPPSNEMFNKLYHKTCVAYNALNRFAGICRAKYTKKYDCDYDFCMNSLSDYNADEVIGLVEGGRIYRFWGKDLYRMIVKKLTQRYDFFPEPTYITNPYTNSKLSLAALYKVYFFLKGTIWGVPKLYEYYFNTNFNMDYFEELYVSEIRDEIINDIVKFMNDEDVLKYTNRMLKDKKHLVNGKVIGTKYPINIVRDNMMGYIKLYLFSTKSVCASKRRYYGRILDTKLVNFFGDNPMFGREIVESVPLYKSGSSFEKTGQYKTVMKYNTNVIPNLFYHPANFDGNETINDIIDSKHSVSSYSITRGPSNIMKRIITRIMDTMPMTQGSVLTTATQLLQRATSYAYPIIIDDDDDDDDDDNDINTNSHIIS